MAIEEKVDPISIPANADLSTKQYYLAVVNSSGKIAVVGSGLACDGIIQNKPAAANRPASICSTPGRISKCISGAAITAGDDLTPNSDGAAITATSGDVKCAKALEAASGSGVIISVLTKFETEPLA